MREVPASRPLGIPPEAWARVSEREKTDTETDVEPAAPGVEIEIDQDNECQFCQDGYDVPEWEEIASEGMKVDAVAYQSSTLGNDLPRIFFRKG